MNPAVRSELLRLSGLRCARCAAAVAHALYAVPGVAVARVAIRTSEASVDYDPRLASRASLVAAVRNAGYNVVDGRAAPSAAMAERVSRPLVLDHLPAPPASPWYPEIELVFGIMLGVTGLLIALDHGSHLVATRALPVLGAIMVLHFFLRRWRRERGRAGANGST